MQRDSLWDSQAPPRKFKDAQNIKDLIEIALVFVVATTLDVIKDIIIISKKPIAWVIVSYLTLSALTGSTGFIMSSLMAPVCKLPLAPRVVPYCSRGYSRFMPDFPKLASLQTRLEDVMDDSASTSIVAVDMKNSEIAVRDLTTLVKLSSLVAKDALVERLNEFVVDAKVAGRNLHKFGGRVGGAVDQIVAMNEYVLKLLEANVKNAQPQISSGPVQRVMNALSPIRGPAATSADRKEIEGMWYQATGMMESTVRKLIVEAEVNMVALDKLEEQLDMINEMVLREDGRIRAQAEEILGELWTMLGGNRKILNNFRTHRVLLNDIRVYRKRALAHVSSTLVQLQQLSADLDDLRQRVATPALAGEESGIPLEVHIGSMQKGTERLMEGRKRSREREEAYLQKILTEGADRPLVAAV
ncbi:transmembrane protein [Ceratobasidium sp. AG-Ba]|nr:transmembrane protein [Ceratobasidium sp. AG-Ba]QRV88987.1 transmembrane protein [Ceratobasidium sp. AG-Ba]QRW03164.1 transmembrane protein [Ceratobasidium sp. AG-Ba]